ncbi:hypothetical protein M9Y10_039721 [Tritrichomonas musculus]|uniref:Uncharacterized protein n=1 Tax=Tritrichomonas musculus TaxID=1915356 RepID=A0ABR2GR24_9EUKA
MRGNHATKEKNNFQLSLNSKIFYIPRDFCLLNEIDPSIYNQLFTNKFYEVKSYVDKKVLKEFINYLIYRKTPLIQYDNINDYEQLSQEFDVMKNIIQIFHKKAPNPNESYPFVIHLKNEKKLSNKKNKLEKKARKYKHAIYCLFEKYKITSLKELKEKFYDSYKYHADAEIEYYIELFLRKKVELNGVSYIINEDDKTVGVFKHSNYKKKIFIPKRIQYKGEEFPVTRIHRGSFMHSTTEEIVIPQKVQSIKKEAFTNCKSLEKIECLPNSELKKICKQAFIFSPLKKLSIPSSIEKFEDKWCINNDRELEITIIPNGTSNIVYYDKDFILGKSNSKSENFDVIVFASKDVRKVTIPSFITKIGSGCFSGCQKLVTIEFSDDSKLREIGMHAFRWSSLQEVTFPRHLFKIGKCAFHKCKKLKKVDFQKDSELLIIGKSSLSESSICDLSIPSSVVDIDENWICDSKKLKKIKIIENRIKNISYYLNDELIVGKSYSKSEIFDVIVFAPRTIENIAIPSFITCIASCAFGHCKDLKKVTFSEHSNLRCIEYCAFHKSSIKSIVIPPSVRKLCTCSFFECNKLKRIEFSNDSELETINSCAFCDCSLESISIPSKVTKIGSLAFYNCHLKTIDFASDSELKIIGKNAFVETKIRSIIIPPKVVRIDEDAFRDCSDLKIIEFADNLRLIQTKYDLFSCINEGFIMKPTKLGKR